MTNEEAISTKFLQIRNKLTELDFRTKPNPPRALRWIAQTMDERFHLKEKVFVPKGCVKINNQCGNVKIEKETPTDRIARTFCALEEFEEWLRRVEEGESKHQEEMERQANAKIARLSLYRMSHP